MKSEEFIIGLSVGIGFSLNEAQEALKIAKKGKEKVVEGEAIRIDGPYNIAIYKGTPLPDKAISLDEVTRDLTILNKYTGETYQDMLKLIEGKKIDSLTGTLTPYGYFIELDLIRKAEEKVYKRTPKRNILLFDGDNMKHWNETYNYEEVTEHLIQIGKALNEHTHKIISGDRKSDLILRTNKSELEEIADGSLVHRKHGTAGDEFIINLRAPYDKLVPIAERLIREAYLAQLRLYKKSPE
jgi:GGDEF domain-containing protein